MVGRVSDEIETKLVMWVESGCHSIKELGADFGVTRKAARKWIKRYREFGREGLEELCRALRYNANRLNEAIE